MIVFHPPGPRAAQSGAPPVGVRLLRAGEYPDVATYRGVSYCDAVRRAGDGERLRILPSSIQVCRWAPVVLGTKPPRDRFESKLAPRLNPPTAGLLLAPLDRFPGDPQVVLVRATPQVLRQAIQRLDQREIWQGHGGRLDRSALPFLIGPGDEQPLPAPRHHLIAAVNRALASIADNHRWQTLTRRLFRSGLITAGFDALISRALADMSVCRNATIIPLLTDRANASFFCTGGITWGHNQADHLISGWPPSQFRRVAGTLLAGGSGG
jgi:hypothetical protein